jgi:ribonuclease P/MRP protein subunit POP5
MRQKTKSKRELKILLPTLREKDRYIAFQIISEEAITYADLEAAVWNTMLDFFGEYGTSWTSVWLIKNLYDEQKQFGVIRCNNKSVAAMLAALGLVSRLGDIRVIVKVLKISGTIKGLR